MCRNKLENWLHSRKLRQYQTIKVTGNNSIPEPLLWWIVFLSCQQAKAAEEETADPAVVAELQREVEDLKLRLLMAAEHYKEKYKECQRLQKQVLRLSEQQGVCSTGPDIRLCVWSHWGENRHLIITFLCLMSLNGPWRLQRGWQSCSVVLNKACSSIKLLIYHSSSACRSWREHQPKRLWSSLQPLVQTHQSRVILICLS